MESEVLPLDNRERKRGREQLGGPDRWDLVGRRVRKEFVGSGVFIGRILRFKRGGLYLVEYEDGDREDLEYEEVCDLLVKEDGGGSGSGGGLCADPAAGKQELGRSVSKNQGPKAPETADGVDRVDDSSAVSKLTSADVESDADSSSDSCESETARLPPLALPPSSGDIGIPEESIGYLFSVYNFLRSFSCRLFLSPFSLDDFVGSLNCMSQNSLLDAIHVSLMRALRRDLEMDSLDGSSSEFTSKCLRRLDWSLLDTLTWPVYVVEYLLIMGYTKEQELKGFHDHVLKSEYYTMPAPTKLRILQILCDDALDSAELRHEINMRGSMEVGMETDGNASLAPENGPRRVHPRYTKTSACKDPVAMENIVEPCESKPPRDRSSTGSSKAVEPEVNMSEDVVDTDECRLCAMDGTLLCCDGCPSVYHSRCIGLNKASLDEGDWFCPECVVNKIGPTCSRIGTGLRGAEFLGIDPHERAFLGTCNYLLVLGTSINAEPIIRYYSQDDVLKVLQVLHSSAQHAPLYSQICKGILQYWEISGDAILSHPAGTEPGVNSLDEKEDAMGSSTFCPQSVRKSRIPSNTDEGYNHESKTSESKLENGALSFQENDCIEAGVNGPSLDSVCQTDLPDLQKDNVVTCEKSGDQFTSGHAELTAQQVGQLGTESAISAGSLIMPIDPSDVNHQSSGERSTVLEFATGASRDVESSGREDADSLVLQMKNSIHSISRESRQHNHGYSGVNKGDTINSTSFLGTSFKFLGTSFKPQAYVNQYIPGDVAASAAAAIARLGSENGKSSESRGASKAKKIVSENTSLQVKAFAEATIHFLWPSSERKLIEIPREKCGWCLACKAPVNSRKGCLFNSAAINALKGAARVLGGVRPIKIGEGQLASIAAYILHMEESLRGLLVGSLLIVSYRRHWRKQVELASSCRLLKLLLLELEENMHILALSGGWVKPVDDWSVESSTTQATTCVVGPAKKRGPVRKNRKQSATSEITPDASSRSHINWWRGGKLSKLVFQKGILPHSIVKRAARQGGYKGIFGINYSQASEIPRRSRRLAWRAAVEMSKNASQLAFQVRCLDAHVRWNDLVRPDQVSQDGKASDTETFTFRNAVIRDKKIVEGKTRYALAFGNQKHLPSRIMKNIVEVETSQDGMERMWFSENHIPLYLIKDYEEKAERYPLPSSAEQLQCFSKFQRRPLKACQKDIFSYLVCRDDKCPCALCQQDVFLRNAVKCGSCQGCCHKDCTVPSTVDMKDGLEFMFTCNRCHQAVSAVVESYKKLPKVPLSPQGQHQMVSNTKSMQQDGYHHITKSVQQDRFSVQEDRFSLQQDRFSVQQDRFSVHQDRFRHIPLTIEKLENHSERKPPAPTPDSGRKSRHGSCLTNGLIWKKKKAQTSESGTDFRLKNILLGGTVDMDPSMEPRCILCSQPYNSDLMYIRCQTCSNWYHADAVQLKEDQIFELEGFRCCKCRRKISPICPYTNPERMKTLLKRASRKQGSITPPVSATSLRKLEVGETTTPVIHLKTENVKAENVKTENTVIEEDNDPLLFSLQNVEPITEQTPEIEPDWHTATAALSQTPQKLPVRRHLKQENEEAATHETNPPINTKEEASCPGVEWEFPVASELADFEGGSMEFEPQTYFSFTELLSTGDERVDGLFEAPVDVSGNWLDPSVYDDMGTVCQSMSPYNSFEAYEMGMGAGPQEFGAVAKPAGDELVPCQMCTHAQPAPDLICETCSLQIHSHCSPWDEPPSCGNRWRCGRCRDWR
ncbi:DDT domain-containing protein PTM-like [Magnolia sinica]|uniref:DDT domain-containing protein PTM-like n=1 Tax=Magnolia sinica TaxID=86752 RepID=UPI002659C280|nr:DDT domain-containing protein PTM-like [Magnolia sinica]